MTKATGTSKRGRSKTPTKQTQTGTETGNSDSTEPILKTSSGLSLESEAKKYRKRRRGPPKPMTSRIYLAGQAMSALIIKTGGAARMEDIRREAYEWAEFMLDDE